MDSYDLESNTKVVENQILNKVQSTYVQLGCVMEMGVACDWNRHSS